MSSWKIDMAHSCIEFSVRHMMISTTRGRFTSFDGTFAVDEAHPEQSSVTGSVDVASITTGDTDRDNHLRSPDFFDVEKYPMMTFQSTRIVPNGTDRYKLYGTLTIRDVTQEIVLDVTTSGQAKDPWGNMHWGFNGSTTIKRKDFDLNWNVALEAGGWLVGDDVKITVELELLQVQPEAESATAG